MRSFIHKFTYTNVVGTLALFVALGGVGWAASLPKHSVGSRQLKKNAVTNSKIKRSAVSSSKIKNHTITGSDIKNHTITGGKVNVASLGTLPSAAAATTANEWLGVIQPVFKRAAVSMTAASVTSGVDGAAAVPLVTSGGISLVGKCFHSGTHDYGAIIAHTSTDATIFWPGTGVPMTGAPFFNAGKPDSSSIVALGGGTAANSANALLASPYTATATAVTPDGHGLRLQVNGFVKSGTLAAGDGVYGPGGSCLFIVTGTRF